MIQIASLVGEVINRNEKGNLVVNVHTYYATAQELVVRDAYVILVPSQYVRGPLFDKPVDGNLIYVQGRFVGNEYGSPHIDPDHNEAVFTMAVEEIQLLAQSADSNRDSDHFQVILVGNLGRDAEARTTMSGKDVASASIATNYKSGEMKITTWFKISAWVSARSEAMYNLLKNMKQGARAFVLGVPSWDQDTGGPSVWFTSSGEPRSSYELSVKRLVPFEKVEVEEYDPEEEIDIPF